MLRKAYLVIAVLLMVMAFVPSVAGQSVSQTWTSSITYYTPSETAGTLQVDYYAANGTKYAHTPITLAPHKAGSLLIGTTSVPDGFAGSAVLSADVAIMATYVQFVSGSGGSQFGRIMYTAFNPEDAATPFYIPTVLYDPATKGSTSQIGVQNVESFVATVTLKFYRAGEAAPAATKVVDIPAQSAYIFRPADAGLAAGFSGSLVIEGAKKGEAGTPAKVVASSEELDNVGRGAYAFEGFAAGANEIYMASMLCNAGSDKQMSYYAIQNASLTTAASVSIDFYDTAGVKVGTMPAQPLSAGGKMSTDPCKWGVASGTSGSAVIKSTGAPIIAIGKVKASTGMATAFVGQAQGYTKIALPYVRWAADASKDFRSYLAIMNVGEAAATNVRVRYYDGNGTMVAEHLVATAASPLNKYIKTNSSASAAGALTSGQFGFSPSGGAVEIISDQPLVVVVRGQRNVVPAIGTVSRFAEDYNGTPIK